MVLISSIRPVPATTSTARFHRLVPAKPSTTATMVALHGAAPQRKLSVCRVVVNSIKSSVGVGVYSIPFMLTCAGPTFGIALLIGVVMTSCFCVQQLVACRHALEASLDQSTSLLQAGAAPPTASNTNHANTTNANTNTTASSTSSLGGRRAVPGSSEFVGLLDMSDHEGAADEDEDDGLNSSSGAGAGRGGGAGRVVILASSSSPTSAGHARSVSAVSDASQLRHEQRNSYANLAFRSLGCGGRWFANATLWLAMYGSNVSYVIFFKQNLPALVPELKVRAGVVVRWWCLCWRWCWCWCWCWC